MRRPVQAIHITPTDILAKFASIAQNAHELILLTGDSGSGKTTWCLELINQARAAGIEPAGLVSPAAFTREVKTGIDLVEIITGERRRLAVTRDPALPRTQEHPALAKLHWLVDPDVLAWGNQALESLLPGELLILDELGPLEFLEETGLTAGVKLVGDGAFRLACVVVRPALLETALERWPWAKVIWACSPSAEVNSP
jgi:nucleoside-triphosphatase THEP1